MPYEPDSHVYSPSCKCIICRFDNKVAALLPNNIKCQTFVKFCVRFFFALFIAYLYFRLTSSFSSSI